MIRCCVPYCKHTSEISELEEITFHAFPTKEAHRAAWLRLLNKHEGQLSEQSVVCSKHFLSTDFYCLDGVKKLRQDAFPSVVQVCLICLDTDSKLISISKHKLQQAYEDLTGLMVSKESNLCIECTMRLLNFKMFREKSLRANALIAKLVEKHKILRIQDVKTVDRKHNNLTSNLIKRSFEANYCDLKIFEYEEGDEQSEIDSIQSYEFKIKSENDDRNSIDYLKTEYLQSEGDIDGFEYDYGVNNLTDNTSWIKQSDSGDEQEFAECKWMKMEDVFRCFLCNQTFQHENLFKEHLMIHTQAAQPNFKNTNKKSAYGKVHLRDNNEIYTIDEENADDQNNAINNNYKQTNHTSMIFNDTKRKRETVRNKSNSNDNSFYCYVCSKRFTQNRYLQIHLKMHFQKEHTCHVCFKSFKTPISLVSHLQNHSCDKILEYSCSICDCKFTEPTEVAKHIITHANSEPYACDSCDYTTQSLKLLTKHSKIHTDPRENLFMCEVCNQTFAKKQSLKTHLKLHTTENMFICDYCGKKLVMKANLVQHIKTHAEEDRLTCKVCHKSFTFVENLKRHFKIHTGEKPYACPLCPYRCVQSNSLRVHLRRHTGDRPFTCEYCGLKLAERRTWMKHLTLHTGNGSLKPRIRTKKLITNILSS